MISGLFLFFDPNNGIAVGTDGLVVTTSNGGQTWEERNSTSEVWIRDISPANNSTIWGCGEAGLLIRSDDEGLNWSPVSHGVTTAHMTCITPPISLVRGQERPVNDTGAPPLNE